jgi:hypothetical protein
VQALRREATYFSLAGFQSIRDCLIEIGIFSALSCAMRFKVAGANRAAQQVTALSPRKRKSKDEQDLQAGIQSPSGARSGDA